MSSDGLSGFAIEPDGNLVSVFSARNGFFSACGKYMVEQGVTKGDCYDSDEQPLPAMYEKYLGFKVASRLAFNREVVEEDHGKEYTDWFVKEYGEASVAFMFMGDAPKGIEKHFKKDEYDKAVDYRNELIEKYGAHKEKSDIRKSMGGLNSVWVLNHCFPNRT